jgi:DNA recombination protein RmuC
MEISTLIIGLAIGAVIGFLTGYFIARLRASGPADLSSLNNLSTQMAEFKAKFSEMENSRVAFEKERESRIREWMESNNRIFKELSEKGEVSEIEKEKRLQELMSVTRKFFDEQKSSTEKFLLEQGKRQEEVERQRDAQLADMKNMIQNFTRTVSGTKTRGMVGEEMLREVLHNSIQAGVVAANLRTDNGEVEFAWKLDANKYIPIDAKLPDVFELVEKYNAASDLDQQKAHKKDIVEKIKKEIKNVQKYQNLSNTIDNCMLVAPPAAIEIAPEIIGIGKESNVFVCTYKDVFPIAHVLQEQYLRMKEEGDVGKYKLLVKSLFQILERIHAKTDTIRTAVTQITNATDSIREEVAKAKVQQE